MSEHIEQGLIELAQKIKPVMRFKSGGGVDLYGETSAPLMYIAPADIEKEAVTWDPKPIIKAKGLEHVSTIQAKHSTGYAAFFKPSVKEVLDALPPSFLEEHENVCAFEITLASREISEIFDQEEYMHISTVKLYAGKLPERMKTQDVIRNGIVHSYNQNQR